ncbi:MAG: PEP-CTERM/exosortase system-associated acyltransferase [Stellaceae bacterium]
MPSMASIRAGRLARQPFPYPSPPPRAERDSGPSPRRSRRPDPDTTDLFNRYLAVVPADSAELLDKALRLRFQVYCLERGFENAADYPDGRECDSDESRSLHSLLLDRATGSAVGTVRLILPRRGDELPVSKLIGAGPVQGAGLPRETTAEVSRFAVAKAFRARLEEGWRPRGGRAPVAGASGPALQLLTFGLIRAVVMMSALGEITHIVAMMEPALLRLLRRLGIAFHPLGKLVNHHGLRQPGWALMEHLIACIAERRPELGEIIADGRRMLAEPVAAHA